MVRRRSWLTAARTCSTFEGVVAVLGWPDRSSLAVEVLPFLKRPNHSKVRLRLMHELPKACFNISKVSLPVLPNLTQNLMHTLCSSTSAIPPISENRRRLMQYTHKDTCKNQTLPHPTTPLGTLTHKTPPQHTLAGNSWTTSDLLVMSIVLGLLDTPSYVCRHLRMYRYRVKKRISHASQHLLIFGDFQTTSGQKRIHVESDCHTCLK